MTKNTLFDNISHLYSTTFRVNNYISFANVSFPLDILVE